MLSIFDSWSDFWDFIKVTFSVLFITAVIVGVCFLFAHGCTSVTGVKLEFKDESYLDTSYNHVFVIFKHKVYGGSSISVVHFPDCPCYESK